jgi:hypothetical protein
LRPSLLNASSGVQISTTGIVIASTGVVVTATTNGDTCCCGGTTGAPCNRCSGSTPAQWVLSFDNVTTSTSCFIQPTEASAKITTGGSPFSGTFTLTQNAITPCLWEYDAPYSAYIAKFWSNDSCSGTEDFTSDRINISLFKFASTSATIKAYLYPTGQVESDVSAHLFVKTGTVPADCTSTITALANGLTAYAFSGQLDFDLGKDGTVDATPS